MPGYTPRDRQPHLSVLLSLPLSRRLLLSLRCSAGDYFFGPCMFKLDGSEEERGGEKRGKNDIGEEGKRETASKSVSICICLGVFVCVAVSAVVLQVQSRCLSFFCSSPASINRSLCVLQLLRGFVLFSLFLFFFPPVHFHLLLLL